jgi:predicted RNA-binding Zn-ribbon protein involved in translation (DUF1610 family)
METNYKGIDYGMNQINKDHDTGIRYGVIFVYNVGQVWYDTSEAYYDPIECSNCGTEILIENECPNCGVDLTEKWECLEPSSFYIDDEEYKIEQTVDDSDIFIIKSPYFTYAQFCSPCAPGAIYITNTLLEKDLNNRGYCLGHDWFEDGQAPYPVYDVKTGKRVYPSK